MHHKEKDVLRQIQELFCVREFAVISNRRSAPQTAKKPFFLKSHLTRWLLSLERESRDSLLDFEMILVDSWSTALSKFDGTSDVSTSLQVLGLICSAALLAQSSLQHTHSPTQSFTHWPLDVRPSYAWLLVLTPSKIVDQTFPPWWDGEGRGLYSVSWICLVALVRLPGLIKIY